ERAHPHRRRRDPRRAFWDRLLHPELVPDVPGGEDVRGAACDLVHRLRLVLAPRRARALAHPLEGRADGLADPACGLESPAGTIVAREARAMMFFRTALIAVALVASACAGGAGPSTQAPQPAQGTPAPEPAVTINVWHGQSGVHGARVYNLVSRFNASHKTQVTGTFQGMYDQLYQKIVSAIQAGSVPDMAMVSGPPQTAQYLKAKDILTVQQIVEYRDGLSDDQLRGFVPAILVHYSL